MPSIRVVIVEDEPLIAMEIADRLSRLGYEVAARFVSGEELLQRLHDLSADLVLMDIRLAGELSGIETAVLLLQCHDLPVVFLSAFSDEELVRESMAAQPFGYLVKPFEERELHATLQASYYRHRYERTLRETNQRLEEAVEMRTRDLLELQTALARSRDDFRALVEESPVGVLVLEPPGLIAYFNQQAGRLLELSPAADSVPPELRELPPNDHIWVREGKEGRQVISVSVSCVEFGGRPGTVFLLRDVTREYELQESVSRSEARYRELFENASDLLYTHDLQGRYTSVNRAFEEITGYCRDELIGRSCWTLLPPEARRTGRRMLERKLRGEIRETSYLTQLITKDGRRRLIELKTKLVQSATGMLEVFGIGRDVSEREELRNRLFQSRQLEALGLLAGGLAHDHANFLAGIIWTARNALHKTRSPAAREALQRILELCEGALQLNRRLLAFGRRTGSRPAVVDLNRAVADSWSVLQLMVGSAVRSTVVQAESPLWVRLDVDHLLQILLNLVVNALEAMRGGGEIRIETESVVRPPGARAGSRARKYAVVRVRDSGCGMDARTLDRIFEPFFSTKPSSLGSGLGLSMVYGLVQQNRGEIRVTSEPGTGTTFELSFPTSRPPRILSLRPAD
jgi:two-component system NtrC family sensor kinase